MLKVAFKVETAKSTGTKWAKITPLPSWLKFDVWGAALLGVIVIAYLPLGLRLGRWLWNRDHYSFFPLAIAVGAVLIAMAMKDPGRTPSRPWLRHLLFGIAFVLLFLSILVVSPWLSGVSGMVMLAAAIYTLGGWSVTKKAMPAWLLLWLVIPIPLSYDRELMMSLQMIATRFSSGILDLLGYRHVVDGVVLRLPTRTYQVEEACSGIQSLFSALFCVGAYLILNRAGVVRSILLLISTFFWVLLANIGRITAVVVLKENYGLPVDVGFYHQLLGVIVFGFTLFAIFSTDRLMSFIWPSRHLPYWRRNESKRTSKQPSERRYRAREVSRFVGGRELKVMLGCFAFLAFIELVSIAMGGSMSSGSSSDFEILRQDDPSLLPDEFHGWKNLGYNFVHRKRKDINGEFTRVWTLEKGDLKAEVSLDGPYTGGLHYLADCYRGQGWNEHDLLVRDYDDPDEPLGGNYLAFKVIKKPDQYGYVIAGLFDHEFRTHGMPQFKRVKRHLGRINDLKLRAADLFGMGDPTIAKSDSMSFQIHVFCKSATPLTDEQIEELDSLYHDFRHQVTGTSEEKTGA